MAAMLNSSFRQRPGTKLGWWAGGLAAAFVILVTINSTVFMPMGMNAGESLPWWRTTLLPFYGIGMMLTGLSAGIVGVIAFFRRREHSWLVWLAMLPGAFVIVFLLGEFLFPH